jgi:cell wall-associated NlpC family hydrolase
MSRWIATVPLLLVTVLASACASTGAVPHPFPVPGGAAASPQPASDPIVPSSTPLFPGAPQPELPAAGRTQGIDAYAVTGTALALRGTPYRNGGVDPQTGFDCSGFTQYVFSRHGLSLPREVRDQYQWGKTIRPEEVAAGDLLFFTTTAPGPTHVAIAIGGDEFVHAPSSTGVVRVEHLSTSYWSQRFIAARRAN